MDFQDGTEAPGFCSKFLLLPPQPSLSPVDLFVETGSHTAWAGLALALVQRMIWNSLHVCLPSEPYLFTVRAVSGPACSEHLDFALIQLLSSPEFHITLTVRLVPRTSLPYFCFHVCLLLLFPAGLELPMKAMLSLTWAPSGGPSKQ